MDVVEIQFNAVSMQSVTIGGPPLTYLEGSTVDTFVRAFDDTVVESVIGKFVVPSQMASQSVTFTVTCMSKTAAGSGTYVKHDFNYVALADDEDFDIAYTETTSGSKEMNSTQDHVTKHTWTDTVTWQAGDIILFKLSRDTSVASDLVGDLYVLNINIKITV